MGLTVPQSVASLLHPPRIVECLLWDLIAGLRQLLTAPQAIEQHQAAMSLAHGLAWLLASLPDLLV